MSHPNDKDRAANLADLYRPQDQSGADSTEPESSSTLERTPLVIVPAESEPDEPDFSDIKIEVKARKSPVKKTARQPDSQTTETWRAFAVPKSPSGGSPYGQRINIVVNTHTHQRLIQLDNQLAVEGVRYPISRVALLSSAVDLIAENPDEWAVKGAEIEAGTYALQGRLTPEQDVLIRQIRNSPTGKRNITAMMAAAVSHLLT